MFKVRAKQYFLILSLGILLFQSSAHALQCPQWLRDLGASILFTWKHSLATTQSFATSMGSSFLWPRREPNTLGLTMKFLDFDTSNEVRTAVFSQMTPTSQIDTLFAVAMYRNNYEESPEESYALGTTLFDRQEGSKEGRALAAIRLIGSLSRVPHLRHDVVLAAMNYLMESFGVVPGVTRHFGVSGYESVRIAAIKEVESTYKERLFNEPFQILIVKYLLYTFTGDGRENHHDSPAVQRAALQALKTIKDSGYTLPDTLIAVLDGCERLPSSLDAEVRRDLTKFLGSIQRPLPRVIREN